MIRKILIFGSSPMWQICVNMRLLAKFDLPARASNKICCNLLS